MKIKTSGKQNLKVFIMGVLPVILAVIVFVLFYLMAGIQAQNDNKQRAADGVSNAAANIRWMFENGVSKLEQVEKRFDSGITDAAELIAHLKTDNQYRNVAVVQGGKIRYVNGRIEQDPGLDKYPNCEIFGRIVRISEGENSIQLRMSLDSKTDAICVFSASDIAKAAGGIFKGNYYYAIYNFRNGSYVYNNMPIDGAGYYDALMTINEHGDGGALFSAYNAQAYFSNQFGKEAAVIAQCRTDISPWGVAFMLPESVLDNQAGSMDYLLIIIGIVIVIQLALSVVFLGSVFRNRRKLTKQINDLADSAENKLEMSVEYTGVCVFEYDRSLGKIIDFHNGMADAGMEGSLCPQTINEFVAYFKPNDDDALHLYEVFAEIKSGETVNADVHAFAHDGERLLRFRLQCMKDGDTIIGNVRDCTQDEFSQIRIRDEEKFLDLMKPKAAAVWDICVSGNRVRISCDKRGLTAKRFDIKPNAWVRYEDEFPHRFREHLHPADVDQFVDSLTLEALMNMYRSGKTESVCDCRIRSIRKEGYEWYRRMLRVFKDPESKEIVARLFMLNVDAEKNAEMERRERLRIHQQTLTAIGSIYYGLYYIELDNDLCYTAKSHAGEPGSDICGPFKTAFAAYIDQYVHEQDRDALRRLIDPYMLRRHVKEDKHFLRCEFRRRVGDHYEWAVAIIQAARFENAQIRDVVLAFEDISDVKAVEAV